MTASSGLAARGQAAPGARRPRSARAGRLLVAMLLLAYAYFVPRGVNWNADSHLALTRALVDHHTAVVDAYQAGLGDKAFYHGHYYTDKAPGLSLLMVVPYALLRLVLVPAFFGSLLFIVRYLLTVLVIGVPSALAAVLLWRRLGAYVGRGAAAAGALAWGLGMLAFPYSGQLFSHQLCAVLLLVAFLLLYLPRVPEPGLTGGGPPRLSGAALAMAGLLCGISFCCEYPTALLGALLLGGRVVWRAASGGPLSGALREALLLGAGFVLGAAPVPLYNVLVFGGPFVQGYAHEAGEPQFVQGMARGLMGVTAPSLDALWGITLSPYRGLVLLCPLVLLALPGLAEMWRWPAGRLRPAAALCAVAVVVYALFNASYYLWDGGYSIGPRHFVVALPFLAVPVTFALRRPIWRALALPLVAFSVTTMFVAVTTGPLFPPALADPLYGWAWPRLLGGHVNNNWGFFLGLRGLPSLAPLLVLEALLGAALLRRLPAEGAARE